MTSLYFFLPSLFSSIFPLSLIPPPPPPLKGKLRVEFEFKLDGGFASQLTEKERRKSQEWREGEHKNIL